MSTTTDQNNADRIQEALDAGVSVSVWGRDVLAQMRNDANWTDGNLTPELSRDASSLANQLEEDVATLDNPPMDPHCVKCGKPDSEAGRKVKTAPHLPDSTSWRCGACQLAFLES